jgi:hypothetical protein
MVKQKQIVVSDEVELDFDEDSLKQLDISDKNLEDVDQKSQIAKKEAKKTAKKLLTPEEKKSRSKKRIAIALGVVLVIFIILLAVPFTRWPILNTIGFRGNLVVTIQDQESRPIVNALTKLEDGTSTATDRFGRAYFQNAALGKRTILIQKQGYGDKTVVVTNGLGATKKQESLKVIGIKLDFDIKDWLSGGPISSAEVVFEKSTATSDTTGRASLIIPPTDEKLIKITISAPGYLNKVLETETAVVSREVSLTSSQKNYFISKREGKFDIFSSNLDGSEQKKIIEATGKEEERLLQFTVNRNNKQAILVANRDGKIQNGRLVAGIYVVDLEKSTLRKVDEGSDIQLFDWSADILTYTKTVPELMYDDPSQARIMNFNTASNKLSEIASANYFSANIVAQGKVFYVPADAYRVLENGVLSSYDLVSGARRTYLPDRPINYIARSGFQALDLQDSTGQAFELQVADGKTKATDRRPSITLQVASSPGNQFVSWTDQRDGQGALIIRTVKDGSEKVSAKIPGLTNPVRFVTDELVVARVATSTETADYVVNIHTGKFKKIVDVSNVGNAMQSGF